MTKKPTELEIREFLEHLLVHADDFIGETVTTTSKSKSARVEFIEKAKDLLARINPSEKNNDLHVLVSDLGLPVRLSNRLKYEEILNVGELLMHSRQELRYIPDMGGTSLRHIEMAVSEYGWARKDGDARHFTNSDIVDTLTDSEHSKLSLHDIGLPKRFSAALEKDGFHVVSDVLNTLSTPTNKDDVFGAAKLRYLRIALSKLSLEHELNDPKIYDLTEGNNSKKRVDLDRSVDDLKLDYRLINKLDINGFCTVGHILNSSSRDILRIRGIGASGLIEIENALSEYEWDKNTSSNHKSDGRNGPSL